MQPTTYNIRYYSGDDFTISVFPKDSTGAPINVGTAYSVYFRVADKRGDNPTWSATGNAVAAQLVPGGPYCIKCDMTSALGELIRHGYVYDIGYVSQELKRVTVLTGNFQVMERVKGTT
jgi:hypothetical protein